MTPVTSETGEGALIGTAQRGGVADTSPDPVAPTQQPPPLASLAVESARRAEQPLWNGSSLLPDYRSRFAGAFVHRAIVRSASDWSLASGRSSIATPQRKGFELSTRVTSLLHNTYSKVKPMSYNDIIGLSYLSSRRAWRVLRPSSNYEARRIYTGGVSEAPEEKQRHCR